MPYEIRLFVPESFDSLLRATNDLGEDAKIDDAKRTLFVCGLLCAFAVASDRSDIHDDIFLLNTDDLGKV